MERTQILLDPKVKKKMKLIAKLENKSLASVVRDAVFCYAAEKKTESPKEALLSMFNHKNMPTHPKDLKPGINSSNFRSKLDEFISPK
jgi:hypothetical protein